MNQATRPVRRVVVIDEGDRSRVLVDGPMPVIQTDPARPGFSSSLLWVTDRSPIPIKGVLETIGRHPPLLVPPSGGSLCRVVVFPPDASFAGRVNAEAVQHYFEQTGSPQANAARTGDSHPYMQQTRTLDFCFVIEGEITLILDTEEVTLRAGEVVVQRGTRHAWSNRSQCPCKIVFSSHDATRP